MDPHQLRSYYLRLIQEIQRKYIAAIDLIRTGNIAAGLRELEELLKMGYIGNEVQVRLMMAFLYITILVPNLASVHLDAVKKSMKKFYLIPYLYAKIAEITGDYKSAKKHFEDAIKLNPNERTLFFEYCVTLYRMDMKEEAYQILEDRIEVASVSFTEYDLLATLHIYDGNIEEAINVLEKAQSIFKTLGFSWKLGKLYLISGKLEDAIKNFEIAHSKISSDPYILTALAICYNIGGNREKTLEYLDDAYKMARSYPDLLANIALSYLRFDIQKAFNIFQDQLEQVGMDADAYHLVGRVYEELKMVKEAYEMYSKALGFKKSHKPSLAKMETRQRITQKIIGDLENKSIDLNPLNIVDKTVSEIKQLYELVDTDEEIKSQASKEDFDDLFNKSRKISQIESPEALEKEQAKELLDRITPEKILPEKQ